MTILEQKLKPSAPHLECTLKLTINLLEVEIRCPLPRFSSFPSLRSAHALTFSSVSPTPPAANKFDYVAVCVCRRLLLLLLLPCLAFVVARYLSVPKGPAERPPAPVRWIQAVTACLFLVAALLRARSPADTEPPEKSILPPTHV